jgi:hypothetical protein
MVLFTAAFENGSNGGFRAVNNAGSVTMGIKQYGPGDSGQGAGFLQASTMKAGGSVAVDQSFSPVAPIFLSASAWVRSRDGPLDGLMTLWGDLDPANNDHPDTHFRAHDGWQFITNAVPVINIGKSPTKITRLEFYMNTVGPHLDIDTVTVAAPIFAANFENGNQGTFRPVNNAASVTASLVQNATDAQSGSGYLRATTTQAGGSVAVDVNIGGAPSQVAAFAWVRSLDGPLDGVMTLWGNLNPAAQDNPGTPFTAEKHWRLLTNAAPVNSMGGPLTCRLEFYMNTVNANLDIDTVVIL